MGPPLPNLVRHIPPAECAECAGHATGRPSGTAAFSFALHPVVSALAELGNTDVSDESEAVAPLLLAFYLDDGYAVGTQATLQKLLT